MNLFYTFKIGLRNFLRHRFYSFLNILGFACGITVFVFVSLFVVDQYLVDRTHSHRGQIFRLEGEMELGSWAVTGTLHGPYLQENYPEVEKVLRVNTYLFSAVDIIVDDEAFHVPDIVLADTTFFDFFPFEFLAGSREHALTDKYSIVITRKQAENIFGHLDVVGKTINMMGRLPLQITGVIENPTHTHLPFEGITPMVLLEDFHNRPNVLYEYDSWNNITFLWLRKGTNIQELEVKINDSFRPMLEELAGLVGVEEQKDYYLRPLQDIYFAEEVAFEPSIRKGDRRSVNSFALIALFILVIAGINFINLSTARAFVRSKEVGVKKLLGSTRQQLILQFLMEAIMVTAFAVLLSTLFIDLLHPFFYDLTDTNFRLSDLPLTINVLIVIAAVLLVGFLSGIYPSFYLTTFQPAAVLKGQKMPMAGGGSFFRKSLIVFQFAISIALISATIIVFDQIAYMKNRSLGMEMDNVLFFDFDPVHRKGSFKNQLLEHPDIIAVSYANAPPGAIRSQNSGEVNGERRQYIYLGGHAGLLPLLGVNLVVGDYFNPELRSDLGKVIVLNERAVRAFGFQGPYQEVVGQEIFGKRIVGVVPDFHFNSPHDAMLPLVIGWDEDYSFKALVKTSGVNTPEVMAYLQSVSREFMPHRAFRPQSLDVFYNRHYASEELFGIIVLTFSLFAILIACLGLFGLASYMTGQRTKEVSVRKVLGASVSGLYGLLLKDFLLLVAIGFLIALPVVWYLMGQWLATFPYQTSLTVWPFIASGFISVLLTVLTISYHAYKISLVNPAWALKYE